jgi:CheY-like chemotaxis protein
LVADASSRLLDRLATTLGDMGIAVFTAPDGAAAFALCQEHRPELVLLGENLPLMDSWAVTAQLDGAIRAGEVTVLLLSEAPPDHRSLREHPLDPALHWLGKPFTDGELQTRVRALLATRTPPPHLRVRLDEMSLGTMLAFFEREQKSGIITAARGNERMSVGISGGRIARVAADDPRGALHAMLDWDEGELEFRACEMPPSNVIDCSISRFLLDHARLLEERETAVRSFDDLLGIGS